MGFIGRVYIPNSRSPSYDSHDNYSSSDRELYKTQTQREMDEQAIRMFHAFRDVFAEQNISWDPKVADVIKLNDIAERMMGIDAFGSYGAFSPGHIDQAGEVLGLSGDEVYEMVNKARLSDLKDRFVGMANAPNPLEMESKLLDFGWNLDFFAEYRTRFDGTKEEQRGAILNEMGLSEEFMVELKSSMPGRFENRIEELLTASAGCDATHDEVYRTFKEASQTMKYIGVDYSDLEQISPEAQENYGRLMGIVYEGSDLPANAGKQQEIDETACPYPKSLQGTLQPPRYKFIDGFHM